MRIIDDEAGGTARHRPREESMVVRDLDPTPSVISVRPVSSRDREALGAMLSRLSRRTIYERFHAPYPSVPAWALAGMLEADHDDREALVAVAGEEILGHAMYVRERSGHGAEFAVVVEDGWQSRGVGKLLLTELAAMAASRGIELFTGPVLGENRRALEALAAIFPGMRYAVRDGSFQISAPLPVPRRGAVDEKVA